MSRCDNRLFTIPSWFVFFFFPVCSYYLNDSKGCKCSWLSSCQALARPLPPISPLPLLKLPWQVQMSFLPRTVQAAASCLGLTVAVICVLEKRANFRVLWLTLLSFVNMACKMKEVHNSYKTPILYFCILRLDEALRCLEVRVCQKHLNYKFSVSFLPEPLKRPPLKAMPVDRFSF